MQKTVIQHVIDALPTEEVDVDAFVERLYLLQKIEQGERQIADGKGIPQEEVEKRFEQWLK